MLISTNCWGTIFSGNSRSSKLKTKEHKSYVLFVFIFNWCWRLASKYFLSWDFWNLFVKSFYTVMLLRKSNVKVTVCDILSQELRGYKLAFIDFKSSYDSYNVHWLSVFYIQIKKCKNTIYTIRPYYDILFYYVCILFYFIPLFV